LSQGGAKPVVEANRLRLHGLQLVYDVGYTITLIIGLPVILVMMLISRRWRAGLGQRLGFTPRRSSTRPAIWVHGVSNGEVLAAQELVALIDAEMPWADVVVSTTTRTGQEAAIRTYTDKQVFYYPLDLSFATRRVMNRMRPDLVLLMELELWPNFLLTTSLRRIPVLLANGRISEKSRREYHHLQRVIPEPMTRVMHYCVQSEEYATRFRSLGVPDDRITITGSMKFDTVADALPKDVVERYRRRLGVRDGQFVLFGGSTHGHEEALLLDTLDELREMHPHARLVVVPRHPDHLREVDAVIKSRGLTPVRLSRLGDAWPDDVDPLRAVVVGDTTGELAKLYVLADLVFVGGTLTPRGGQNMMEPAGLGIATVVGPNTWNFRDPMELLLSREGIVQAEDETSVRQALVRLAGDPPERARLGENARGICRESKGATRRILDILRDYVPNPAADRPRAAATAGLTKERSES
jgi:3-deoxy-D-manno-octulosonic-acid transferase